MSALNSRLKAWREEKRLNQAQAANLLGVPVATFIKWEVGTRAPGAAAIEAFVTAGGINANWLLTGEGPMRIEDLAGAETPGALDRERMRLAMEAIEEGLSEVRLTMAPPKKAELLLAAYDLLETDGVTKEKVMKIVKLAA